MSWDTDTNGLLDNNDGDGGTVVTVKKIAQEYNSTSVYPESATSIIETATVLIFPVRSNNRSGFVKGQKGYVEDSSHTMFFPATSSVAVGHRIFESGETDYYEVNKVGDYDGHKEVDTQKVENR